MGQMAASAKGWVITLVVLSTKGVQRVKTCYRSKVSDNLMTLLFFIFISALNFLYVIMKYSEDHRLKKKKKKI